MATNLKIHPGSIRASPVPSGGVWEETKYHVFNLTYTKCLEFNMKKRFNVQNRQQNVLCQVVLKWVPLNFHPVLCLVNKKLNSVVENKYCWINCLMFDASIEFLEFILTRPNATKFVHPDTKNTRPYSLLFFVRL